jgi:predicted sugar kinase
MNMRRLWVNAACALALACACAAAQAHRFHAGITDIAFNARTGNTEVVHTYMAHDVEALLANLYQRQFDLSDPDDQAVLRKYLEKQFWLADKAGKRLPLSWIGLTVDTDSVTVFQEIPATPAEKVETIHAAVLIDFLPDQVNTVNYSAGGSLRTFGFDARQSELSVH